MRYEVSFCIIDDITYISPPELVSVRAVEASSMDSEVDGAGCILLSGRSPYRDSFVIPGRNIRIYLFTPLVTLRFTIGFRAPCHLCSLDTLHR